MGLDHDHANDEMRQRPPNSVLEYSNAACYFIYIYVYINLYIYGFVKTLNKQSNQGVSH